MKVQDNILKDAGRLVFWHPIRWLANLLPCRTVGFIGKMTGHLDYYLFKGRAEKIGMNLRHAFGNTMTNRRSRDIVKKILANHYTLILEFFKYPQIVERNIASIVSVEGLENLDNALAQGRGAIIGHCHFGAKLLLIIVLGLNKYSINQIAYHMPKEELTYIREKVSLKQRLKIERSFKVNYIYLSKGLRRAFSCLDDNEVLMVAIDGKGILTETFSGSVCVNFLGQNAYFASGVATLSRRKRTPILPAAVFRKDDGTYRMVISPPIEIDYENEGRAFASDVIEKLIAVFEGDIRRHPDQWEYWEEFGPGEMDDGQGR
ncbi:MAG: phosphatidylinositol dimannoside acyltransferase [Thermodesulfobacteriota bacterium]|nr:phosphatidylinositol dimannoside acyltransferase [Thermodesulfobacteriota bacterium]